MSIDDVSRGVEARSLMPSIQHESPASWTLGTPFISWQAHAHAHHNHDLLNQAAV